MCLPFCHKWKTVDVSISRTYAPDSDGTDLPISIHRIIQQQCEKCGKEVVRRFKTSIYG